MQSEYILMKNRLRKLFIVRGGFHFMLLQKSYLRLILFTAIQRKGTVLYERNDWLKSVLQNFCSFLHITDVEPGLMLSFRQATSLAAFNEEENNC